MIDGIHLSHIWVLDQNEALEFYVGKLGLEVASDVDLGAMRWLTVRVPGQPEREIFLEKVAPPSIDPDAAEKVRELIAKGASGFAAGFTTKDCRALYEDLVAKGVEITQEPVKQFYGTDMGVRDPFGNHLRIVQFAERSS